MIRRFVLALLPVAGFALGVALAARPAPSLAGTAADGWLVAAAVLGCVALAVVAWALAAPLATARAAARRRAISPRPGAGRADPPTLSGYWRAHDEPDWPEGEVRPEREREEDPAATAR
jgi:hypothetical protein